MRDDLLALAASALLVVRMRAGRMKIHPGVADGIRACMWL